MKKFIFLGDSITDANHNLGVDEKGLGDGYVSIIARYLERDLSKRREQNHKSENFKILNRGHDGFTLRGIMHFLARDCILQQPDVVSVLIGCNDVGIMMNTGKTLEERCFSKDYDTLLCEIKEETDVKIICMAPFIFPYPQKYMNWIPHIKYIEDVTGKIAEKHQVTFIPLHDKLQQEAEKWGYDAVTTDGIHLTALGAKVVADEWYRVWHENM